jgi:outer membrane protein
MKNLSLVLNGVLLIAVIILYVLFFNKNKKETVIENSSTVMPVDNSGLSAIAFVELDTIL